MRRLLIVLLVLIAVLVPGDVAARAFAERRAAEVVERSLDLPERPRVALGGFPFVLGMARGSLPSMTLAAEGFTSEGVEVESLEVSLHEVDFSVSDLLSGDGVIQAGRGDGTATLTAEAVTSALRDRGIDVQVRFDSGVVVVESPLVGTVEGTLRLEGPDLTIHPTQAGLPSVSLTLPEVFDGVRFTSARVTGSTAVVWFTLADTTFAF